MPPWYYIRPVLLNSIPFSLFVPLAVIAALMPRRLGPHQPKAARAAINQTGSAEAPCCSIPAPLADRKTVVSPTRLTGPALEHPPLAARAACLLAMFWLVSVIFFDLAAYKRRAYLLPLWPASAFLLAWWTVEYLVPLAGERFGSLARRAVIAICLVATAANFVFVPAYELHGCGAPLTLASLVRWPSRGFAGEAPNESGQTESYRAAAARINRLTRPNTPLYSLGFDQALEPLIFYLGRCAPPLYPPISVPPDARIIAPSTFWNRLSARYPYLSPLGNIPYDNNPLVLLGPRGVAGGAAVP
jgi:hypothetical protein